MNNSRHDNALATQIREQGFAVIGNALPKEAITRLLERCIAAFETDTPSVSARSESGHAVAARNVIESVPEVLDVWRQGSLSEVLTFVLGSQHGLVRVLFFDKPPDRTWVLPWHKDMSIAVEDNMLPSSHFSRPTLKAGVPHVIASDAVLGQMLTLRIHLDEVTDENGPLRVIPGSHSSSVSNGLGPAAAVTIKAQAGDVLAMRPLIDHCSGPSMPGTRRHRRILHLEFAANEVLPDGYHWYQFVPRILPGNE